MHVCDVGYAPLSLSHMLTPSCVSACRAVWVPGQDLAALHLMHNCGKHIYHYMLYVCLSTHTHDYAIWGVFASGSRNMSTHDSK